MTTKVLSNNIKVRKKLLNFLLNYLLPSNKFIIYLSQNLDMLVSKRQQSLYVKHKNKHMQLEAKSKKINTYMKTA